MADDAVFIVRRFIIKARPTAGDEAVPVGYIHEWGGSIPSDMYLLCDGRQHMNNSYPELATALAGQHGGTTPPSRHWRYIGLYGFLYRRWLRGGVFNVPDLRGRVMLGVDPVGESPRS